MVTRVVLGIIAEYTAADDGGVSLTNGGSEGWVSFDIVDLGTIICRGGIHQPGGVKSSLIICAWREIGWSKKTLERGLKFLPCLDLSWILRASWISLSSELYIYFLLFLLYMIVVTLLGSVQRTLWDRGSISWVFLSPFSTISHSRSLADSNKEFKSSSIPAWLKNKKSILCQNFRFWILLEKNWVEQKLSQKNKKKVHSLNNKQKWCPEIMIPPWWKLSLP